MIFGWTGRNGKDEEIPIKVRKIDNFFLISLDMRG